MPRSYLKNFKPEERLEDMNALIPIGIALILVGFALTAVGFFLTARVEGTEGSEGSTVHGGGIIMIGPIPIVFGTDKKSAAALVVLAIVLMIISLLFLLLTRRIT
jgi:uncharacterized protein (TIGR00304 family)